MQPYNKCPHPYVENLQNAIITDEMIYDACASVYAKQQYITRKIDTADSTIEKRMYTSFASELQKFWKSVLQKFKHQKPLIAAYNETHWAYAYEFSGDIFLEPIRANKARKELQSRELEEPEMILDRVPSNKPNHLLPISFVEDLMEFAKYHHHAYVDGDDIYIISPTQVQTPNFSGLCTAAQADAIVLPSNDKRTINFVKTIRKKESTTPKNTRCLLQAIQLPENPMDTTITSREGKTLKPALIEHAFDNFEKFCAICNIDTPELSKPYLILSYRDLKPIIDCLYNAFAKSTLTEDFVEEHALAVDGEPFYILD